MRRISDTSVQCLARSMECSVFNYARDEQKVGIVHFGAGAFHRAHQAWYTDRCMARGERNWMISGVSLRSPKALAQLNPQRGLYTVTERSGSKAATRLIGAIREVLVADRHSRTIVDRIAAPACHIVSFTITEKGYCRNSESTLDFALAEAGFYPLLTEALARRRDDGLAGLTLLSCDNLADNGRQLERLMGEYLSAKAPDLAQWFANECTCPCTMVDRIVPATTPADLDVLQRRLDGFRDEGAVFTEVFSQWVIEDNFAGLRPRWEDHGAQLVADVAPYEAAKLRMLNGAHSLLAYCGLEAGHEFVHQAIADPAIRPLVEQLMLHEAAPTVAAAPGQDLPAYAAQLLERFENPALAHRLAQIAMDGSQKIPQRWLAVLAERKAAGLASPAIFAGLAAWLRHVRGIDREVDDPLAAALAHAWTMGAGYDMILQVFGATGLVPSSWQPDQAEATTLALELGQFTDAGIRE